MIRDKIVLPETSWLERYRLAVAGSDEARLTLAQALAAEEYHHLECEAANALPAQRSFCFEHGKITASAVLVIHGWTACPFEVRELGEELFHRGFNVFGTRLAGHGTRVVDFRNYGQQDWEASAEKGLFIAALLGHNVYIVGESMGAALATVLATKYPELIAKIALCAPAYWVKDWKAELSRISLIRYFIPTVDFGGMADWQKIYWYKKIPVTAIRELLKVAHKARRLGPQITVPSLIIQANNDRLVNPKGAKRFYQTLTRLPDREKRLILFEKGHHNLTLDLNPQKTQVFTWIKEFIG